MKMVLKCPIDWICLFQWGSNTKIRQWLPTFILKSIGYKCVCVCWREMAQSMMLMMLMMLVLIKCTWTGWRQSSALNGPLLLMMMMMAISLAMFFLPTFHFNCPFRSLICTHRQTDKRCSFVSSIYPTITANE